MKIDSEKDDVFPDSFVIIRSRFIDYPELTTSKKNHSIDPMMAISFSSSLHWHLISQAITGDLFSHFVSLELERFPLILSRESKTRVLTVQSLFFTRGILVIISSVFSLSLLLMCLLDS